MKLNFKKVSKICASAFIFGIFFGWIIFPTILKVIVKKQVVLKKGAEIRDMWEKIPFPLHFLVYVFNITNPEELLKGQKPILQEVGPYFFEEWKEKYDLDDDEKEDTVSFNMRNTFIFRPDKSNGLTGEEIIILPNILYLSIGLAVKRDRPGLINMISKALKIIFPEAQFTLSVRFLDIFFRGLHVDCSSTDFNVKALCSAFSMGEIKYAVPYNQTHFLFSLMGANNATDAGRYTVCRGIKNNHKLGKVIRFENEPELDKWNGDECNQFHGTDSTIFPPFMTREEGVWAFVPQLCRSMGAQYIGKSSYSGLPASKYYLDMGNIQADESLHCFCNEPPDDCPKKGTMDLMQCSGAPLTVSMPHFYNGDPSLFEDVIGMSPNREKHAIFINFERKSGTPLTAANRLQFNLDIEPIEEIDILRNVKKMQFPLLWVEEGVRLNKTYVNMLKYTLFLGLKINNVIRWLCITFGGIGALGSGYLYFKEKVNSKTIPLEKGTIENDSDNKSNETIATSKIDSVVNDGFDENVDTEENSFKSVKV